ncbi:glycosyltransferase [Cellulomonas sp. P24]|uniref:glycosyltransferase n=1 Tax=Cellulomonas sp. P24 TaxID=2885206 RepID=UPI00216AF3C5|nr:glycosyltransferase [Cellulomonas sp. P24]MCR6493754.1 glycosyltransferase [Cellulomonas sp. P24]
MTPATPSLRVLLVDHTAELGGAELALVRLCAALGDDVDVRCLLFQDGELRVALRDLGIEVDVLPLSRSVQSVDRRRAGRVSWPNAARAAQVVPFLWRLTRHLRRERPDVVHTTSLKADLLTLIPAAVTRTPLVWHVHDRISPDYLPTTLVRSVRWLARFPREVVVNSRATAGTLPRSTTVAYPGFAPEQGIVPSREIPARGSTPVIGLIGRISPTKGQLEFVRAAAVVRESYPHAEFRIIGAPTFGAEEYAAAVRREAEHLGVADRVTWVGSVEDTASELDRMTICVHASPVPEPFGQVVVEAMIRGVPVVATAEGGVPEILRPVHEPLGSLVPAGDVAAISAAVLEILDDPRAAAVRAEHARSEAYRLFPIARTAEVVTEVWRRAVRSAR